jgi:hypothetical protein
MKKEDASLIVEDLCRTWHVDPLKVFIRPTQRGWARKKSRRITLPAWLWDDNYWAHLHCPRICGPCPYGVAVDLVQFQYAVHEFCHHLAWATWPDLRGGHPQRFLDLETWVLGCYGIKPIYRPRRVYATCLTNLSDNVLVVLPDLAEKGHGWRIL